MSDRLHSNVRAGLRQTLLSVTKATLSSSGASLTKLDASTVQLDLAEATFDDSGFSPGDEIVLSGSTPGNNGSWYARQVAPTQIVMQLPAADVGSVSRVISSQSAGAALTLTVGWPTHQADAGITYEPEAAECWVRESYKGGPEQRRSLLTVYQAGQPAKARVRLTFLYMLNVFYPNGLGTSGVDELVDAIRAALYPGRIITYNSQTLTILSCSRQGELQTPDWINVPVSVRGFTDTLTP